MKKYLNIIAAVLLFISLTACTKQAEKGPKTESSLKITAAIFPAYDWTRNILGENPAGAELRLLVDNGVDLHSYQPSVDDILSISQSNLFIYVGGESDQWVTDTLKQANNPDLHILRMIDAIGEAAKTEEITEGMQNDEEEEEEAYDEHIWLSLRNASVLTRAIAEELCTLDPAHADIYRKNAESYQEKLAKLDEDYVKSLESAGRKILLFGDRFPFRYLADDYDLSYYAAFPGCSAETEASFETISFLAQKCDEFSLPAVLTIDGGDQRIAETIVKSTISKEQKILVLDSMQSVTATEMEAGVTYLSVMEKNLDVLKQALEAD